MSGRGGTGRTAGIVVAALVVGGCSAAGGASTSAPTPSAASTSDAQSSARSTATAAPSAVPTTQPSDAPSASPSSSASASPSEAAPAAPGAALKALNTYPVKDRRFRVTRDGRVIEVYAWFPAATRAGGFPVVLFSHGLTALPTDYFTLATRWASRGVVVVAPRYPNTSREAPSVEPVDLLNQPADASAVIDEVLRLARRPGDAFADRVDAGHIVAAGHSLGGITTVGLLSSCCRDARLKGGIVLAGNDIGFSGFSGSPVPVLFVHGDADPVVPYSSARSTYTKVPWPKGFVTLTGQGHTLPFTANGNADAVLVEALGAAFLTAVARNESPWALVRATVGKASGVTVESVPAR